MATFAETLPSWTRKVHSKMGSGLGGRFGGGGGGVTTSGLQGMSSRSWPSLMRMTAVSGTRLRFVPSACANSFGFKVAIQRSSRKLMVASPKGRSLAMATFAETLPSWTRKVHSKIGSPRVAAPAVVVLASTRPAKRASPPVMTTSHRPLMMRLIIASFFFVIWSLCVTPAIGAYATTNLQAKGLGAH